MIILRNDLVVFFYRGFVFVERGFIFSDVFLLDEYIGGKPFHH